MQIYRGGFHHTHIWQISFNEIELKKKSFEVYSTFLYGHEKFFYCTNYEKYMVILG